LNVIPLKLGEVVSAALFFWNYYPYGNTWFLGHIWSLSVEEQFYLLWPLLLKANGPRRAGWIALVIIAIEPIVRVANYFLVASMRGHISIMGHTRADALMVGSLAALLSGNERFEAGLKRLFAWKMPLLGTLFILFIDPILQQQWRGSYLLPLGFSLENFSIVLLMLWAVRTPSGIVGRILNSTPVVHIGHISFSLYLWQQLFLTTENKTVSGLFPLNVVATFAVAECSYWFVEKPFLRWRKLFVRET
jgi:peptidoglycan/LPS O-acetylase OafA/YrhL